MTFVIDKCHSLTNKSSSSFDQENEFLIQKSEKRLSFITKYGYVRRHKDTFYIYLLYVKGQSDPERLQRLESWKADHSYNYIITEE